MKINVLKGITRIERLLRDPKAHENYLYLKDVPW
jgi:hypothetical protein